NCYAQAARQYGRARAHDIWAMTVENHAEEIGAIGGQEVGHRQLGSITLASGEGEVDQLAESAEMMREDGFSATWDGRALFNPVDGEVIPSLLVGAFARQAAAGAIREGVEVTGLESSARAADVIVTSNGDECRAGCVILATNAYTPQLVPQIPITPTRAQMLASQPEGARLCDFPTYSHFGYRYWRQMPTGEVLVGGWRDTSFETEVGYDAHPTPQIQSRLEAHLRQLGADGEVTHRWAGIMGFTENGLPMVGPVE